VVSVWNVRICTDPEFLKSNYLKNKKKKNKKLIIQYNTIQYTIQNGITVHLFPLERLHGEGYKGGKAT